MVNRFKRVDGVRRPLTAAEETARDLEEAAVAAGPSPEKIAAVVKQRVDADINSPLGKAILAPMQPPARDLFIETLTDAHRKAFLGLET